MLLPMLDMPMAGHEPHLLDGFPIEALPFADGTYKGKHSYTVYVGDAA